MLPPRSSLDSPAPSQLPSFPCASLDLPCSSQAPISTLPRTPAISSASAVPSPRTPPWPASLNFPPQPVVPARPPGSPPAYLHSTHPLLVVGSITPRNSPVIIFLSPVPGLIIIFSPIKTPAGIITRLLSVLLAWVCP